MLFSIFSFEVDKTGGSYYGKQQLNYMSVKVSLLSLALNISF